MNWFRYDRSLRHERVNSAVCKAIFKLVYRFEIANSNHQTLKSVKNNSSKKRQITVHSLVPQCALSVFSFSECKITKNFPGLCPYPTGKGFQRPPDSPAAQRFFSSLRSSKNRHHKKIVGHSHWLMIVFC